MGKFALDVSNNRTATRAQVKESGAEILLCKATEGTGFKDVTLAIHREIAHELGIAFGSYVFLHPDSTGSEADYYLEYAKPKKGDIQPIIDAETFSGVFKHRLVSRHLHFAPSRVPAHWRGMDTSRSSTVVHTHGRSWSSTRLA